MFPKKALLSYVLSKPLSQETQSGQGQASTSTSAELQSFSLQLSAQSEFRLLSAIECAAGQQHHPLTELGSLPRPRGVSSSCAKPDGTGGYDLLHGFETAATRT